MPKARPILKDPPIILSLPYPPVGDVIRNPLSLLESRGGGTHPELPSRYDHRRPCRRREDSAKRRSHRRGHRDHGPLPPRRRGAPPPARHPRGDVRHRRLRGQRPLTTHRSARRRDCQGGAQPEVRLPVPARHLRDLALTSLRHDASRPAPGWRQLRGVLLPGSYGGASPRRVARQVRAEERLIWGIEFEAVAAIAEMELAGVKLDVARWKELEVTVRERRDRAADHLESFFPPPEGVLPLEGLGPRLNLNSPKQITDAFQTLGIDLPDTKVWTLLKVDHPAAKALLEYRELQKKLGTYLETYPGFISPKTGRIHANFLQCRVPTGRLACTAPNIQQIPHEDEFRRCFVAEDGNTLVIADYSQIELRILAEVSEDPAFVGAFQRGMDLHRLTAATMYNVSMDEVTKDQRSAAKRINFGLMYGRGARSLSAQLGTDEDRGRQLIDEYFANYPKVQRFLQRTANRAMRDRTLRTLAGRVRKFGPSTVADDRGALRREAMNYPIQGASADIAKLALGYVREELEGLDARLINCIHDEFVVECAQEISEEVSERTRAAMIRAGEEILNKVPVDVEVAVSREWRK